ncbi:MAG: 2-C-methyl-D-erythritol 2,4-cyclodiphosphate synthase [Ruminococcus sp.]|nr:2-C-methyl-D-erythritol 2,4-cyclodiphosphate synthase [Ruminococcus sp.]
MRIGHGYDVHKFADNRKLILGGVEIPYEKGLLGHSDADVLLHAIMDALLGAAALGDIGKLFPDNDDTFLNADSLKLLEKTVQVLKENDYKIINIDSTVIAQKPKLKDYIISMREKIAKACNTELDQISVKATTEEGLGFTGELLGISAHAVCLIEKVN